ncbi:MAG TPA: serine hydrolase, partial [Gemmatimonadaceae bacterium]
ITAGGYPGAAVVVGRRGSAVWEKGFGKLGWSSSDPRVDAQSTIYDLASLTKVVGTTTALMILYDDGKISLDDPVSKYLPEFSGGDKDLVTIRLLLEHRSGLPAGRDIWRMASSPADARRAVLSTPLYFHPGRYYEYSDLGADVLGFVVEAAAGKPMDQFLSERVFTPLGMINTGYRPNDSLRARIAPTEDNPPRGYPLRGEVHDENAYALGGVAGHAGLFSTAADLSVFAQMMLNGGEFDGKRLIADSTVALFTHRAAATRALGWDTCGGSGSCGKYLSDRAYGHTGFTGTSLWIDPDRQMFVILLTNRVHEPRAKRPATVIEDIRADLADAAVLSVTDNPEGMLEMPASFRADKALGWNKPLRRVRHRKPPASAVIKKTTTSPSAVRSASATKTAPSTSATTRITQAGKPAPKPPATKTTTGSSAKSSAAPTGTVSKSPAPKPSQR